MAKKLTDTEREQSLQRRRMYMRDYMRIYRKRYPDRVLRARVAQAKRLLARYTEKGDV